MGETFWAHLASHVVGLVFSVTLGGAFTGWVLSRLRLINATTGKSGPLAAGRTIGRAERFLIYLIIVFRQPQLLAALIAIKTIVRYPEVKAAHESQGEEGGPQSHFAEYYLVGTLVSVCFGVAIPLGVEGFYRVFLA